MTAASLAAGAWAGLSKPHRPPPLDIARLVGPTWHSLPASLRRRFTPGHAPARYAGTLALRRSAIGLCFAWLARAVGAPLPPCRADVAATVTVTPLDGGVVWDRSLAEGGHVRSTKLPGPAGTLLERTDGGLGMVLDVTVEDGALVFTSRSFYLGIGRWRLPIPALLTPGRCRVAHRPIDTQRFRFTLTMTHPLWGTTFRQDGVFAESPVTPPARSAS